MTSSSAEPWAHRVSSRSSSSRRSRKSMGGAYKKTVNRTSFLAHSFLVNSSIRPVSGGGHTCVTAACRPVCKKASAAVPYGEGRPVSIVEVQELRKHGPPARGTVARPRGGHRQGGRGRHRRRPGPTGFVLSSPGMLVNFILFSLLIAGIALIQERRNFTLLRLMTTRVRRWELIAGKAVGMFALTFVQQIILIGAGQLLFGVDYLRDPAALLLMMVALSLVASTLGLLLAAVLTSEQAMVATTVIVSMSVAALSGAWFPLDITGPAFCFAGHLLPTAWILDGLRGIIVRGFDVADVLPAFGVALAWSAALFALAVWRFRLTD